MYIRVPYARTRGFALTPPFLASSSASAAFSRARRLDLRPRPRARGIAASCPAQAALVVVDLRRDGAERTKTIAAKKHAAGRRLRPPGRGVQRPRADRPDEPPERVRHVVEPDVHRHLVAVRVLHHQVAVHGGVHERRTRARTRRGRDDDAGFRARRSPRDRSSSVPAAETPTPKNSGMMPNKAFHSTHVFVRGRLAQRRQDEPWRWLWHWP